MRSGDSELIRALPLFQEMDDAHFEELIKAAFLQRFPDHVVLIREGEFPDFLHVVVEGSVELFAANRNRETTIGALRPVTTFILAAVVQDQVYLKSARTLAPSRILMIPAEAVRAIFSRDAGFARAIVRELAIRYRGIVRTLKNQKLRTGVERLANWILQADHGSGRFVAQSGDLEHRLHRQRAARDHDHRPEEAHRDRPSAPVDRRGPVSGRSVRMRAFTSEGIGENPAE
jgi:CRP/FNR family transcriptional activator FtrB